MTNQKAKDYLKKQYPKFQGFIEHTMVAEMALNLAKEYHKEQLLIHSVVSSFLCKGCGSDNIKERSGYKVCFDCGKGH